MDAEVKAVGPWPAPDARRPGAFARGTLGRRLLLRVVGLVAAIAVVLSGLTTVATWQLLVGDLDGQLRAVASRVVRDAPPIPGRPQGNVTVNLPGQPIGTLVIIDSGAKPTANVLGERGILGLVSKKAGAQALEVTGPQPVTIDLDRLGRYRIMVTMINGFRVVVGLPLNRVDSLLSQLVGLEIILSLIAILATVIIARPLISRSLRPLNRVAGVAQQVSALRLDRGAVAVDVRVPEADADPTSEVGRVGQALNHLLANVDGALTARQASETKVRRFVADASHELRNPLAAIRGYAELTRRDRDQLEPDTSYALDRIDAEAGRMSVLVEDLLLLARLDDRPELDLKPTDLSELVINAVSDARVAGPDHQWELDLPPEPVQAKVDHHRVHQVLVNLLANARTHTPAGSTVLTRLTEADGTITIMVRDDGPGVPPGIVDHVFERFTRAEASRARAAGAAKGASTGLGLAIVAAVVEAHHGTVSVASRPGRTEFTVTLPATGASA
ncbi:sensor histidine kinase [Microlunatus sp. GCM10028923]|uniref:sensor histidine kinase n=1 Tax=Microlunatus sp. GCM10028923 TaxID=3273400 RepID=UPI0036088B93